MNQFTFRLERVRALRERSEDLAKQELAGAMTRRGACEARLRETGVELDAARDKQRDLNAGATSAQDLIARQLYLERVERNRTLGQQELVASEAEVENRRGLLVEAARDRQALERLKERRRLDHARELARVEGAAMDEIALTLHRRRAA
ncbi:flagellar export protein FliJ [Conexibacter sp. JD483]|uniref:flagellar export protein FliJ n=1 Tax=unclassified Conexibacter TaxID=2627773 RepID=UPI002727DDE0|nr:MULTISPECIES: flagellar export protein FliJ [unclassified Conexibacter]MDO8184488.1 flagellar export protein FliJ [Conexibacter sp. CPCC 205706]MDO8197794.1 flagellar export protein FliJ [Conexibacter sp. CPCC 205762]MDR9368070.1 flagellar export protein FliJ [Conexibacter sp. JD483]